MNPQAPDSEYETRWATPFPYGHAAAIDSMGGIAAPLLAGFSVTLAALVVSSPASVRWVDVCLGLCITAALALVASMQFAFRAKLYAVSPTDIEQWWPNPDAVRQRLRREQRYHRHQYAVWSNAARVGYNVGLLLFLGGIAASLMPRGTVGSARIAVFALAVLGAAAEACWIMKSYYGVGGRALDLTPFDPSPEYVPTVPVGGPSQESPVRTP